MISFRKQIQEVSEWDSVGHRVRARKKMASQDKEDFMKGFQHGWKHKVPDEKRSEAYHAGHKAGKELMSQHYSPEKGWTLG